jgi:hypothetical protein
MNKHEKKSFAILAYNKIKTNIQFSKFWWNENIKIYKGLINYLNDKSNAFFCLIE